jgi:DNA-binding NarL/FixJ family response regulator
LCLEASTVKSHVSRILLRLNLGSRQQLIAELWRSGFMAGEEGRMTG